MIYSYYVGFEAITPCRFPGTFGKVSPFSKHNTRDSAVINVHAILFTNQQLHRESLKILLNARFVIEVSPFSIAFLHRDTKTDCFELNLPSTFILNRIRHLEIRLEGHWSGQLSQPHSRVLPFEGAYASDSSTAAEVRNARLDQLKKNLSTTYAALPNFTYLESVNILFRPYELSTHTGNKDLQCYTASQLREIGHGFDRLSRQILEGSLVELPFRTCRWLAEGHGLSEGGCCWMGRHHPAIEQEGNSVNGMGVGDLRIMEFGFSFLRRGA